MLPNLPCSCRQHIYDVHQNDMEFHLSPCLLVCGKIQIPLGNIEAHKFDHLKNDNTSMFGQYHDIVSMLIQFCIPIGIVVQLTYNQVQ